LRRICSGDVDPRYILLPLLSIRLHAARSNHNGCQDLPVRGARRTTSVDTDISRSTGVTGYIAGDAFSVLQSKHPEYEYAVLVRSEEKGDVVKKAYPGTRIVIGDLDNSDVLKQEASKADIVLRG